MLGAHWVPIGPDTESRIRVVGGNETVAMVEIKNLNKWFGDHHVLRDITMEVEHGEVVSVIGPSGSGKSTLLRCINFVEEYEEGEIWVDGALVGKRRRADGRLVRESERRINIMRANIGIIFQNFNLFPHMTVLENVIEAPVRVRKVPRAQAVESAEALLARVGLQDKRDAYPEKLSGGQQQRVGIVRALAMKPKLLLFDEVTSALDPELVQEVLDVIRQLAADGMTMFVVTHEMQFAMDVSNRMAFLDEGELVEFGPPDEIFCSSRSERLKNFLRKFMDPAARDAEHREAGRQTHAPQPAPRPRIGMSGDL